MLGSEFMQAVKKHAQLHFGEGPRQDRVYIVFLGPDACKVGWELEPSAVRKHPWETLEAVLTGRRRPEIISHISRIVGYYSIMRSWNRSKLAEHRDRQKGDYGTRRYGATAA